MNVAQSKVLNDLARRYPEVAALVRQRMADQTVLVQQATFTVTELVNGLHFLTEQATAGNPQARDLLKLLANNLDQARAATAGIVTVRETNGEVH
jgi:hypothetical protein